MKRKVCGMKYNTQEVAALQPDYLGFIFYDKSKGDFEGMEISMAIEAEFDIELLKGHLWRKYSLSKIGCSTFGELICFILKEIN